MLLESTPVFLYYLLCNLLSERSIETPMCNLPANTEDRSKVVECCNKALLNNSCSLNYRAFSLYGSPETTPPVQDCCRFLAFKGAESLCLLIVLHITSHCTAILTPSFKESLAKEGCTSLTRIPIVQRKMCGLHF